MEGRPLDAQFVAGRRFVGEGDRPLSSDDIKAALTPLDLRLIEMPILPGQHESVVGLYRGGRSRHIPHGDIFIKSTMSAEDKNLTTAHEFGHAIDHFSDLMFKRLLPEEIDELRKLYTTLRVGPRKTPFPQPEDFGYDQRSVPRELLAEGLRAYLMNPNYFKAVAPRTAATIRAEVNDNPYLKHIIQFNSLGAAGLIGAGLGNRNQDDQ
jgi:hypothetical protein